MTTLEFIQFCIHQHDVECNQKYDDKMPYSFHLSNVYLQALFFRNLLESQGAFDSVVTKGCYGHDLIEDARITYNDIKEKVGEAVADVIFACTEEKGKNRKERHSDKYYSDLAKNELAIFVKLCDIISNVKYSIYTNSSMLAKYKTEYITVREKLYVSKYDSMFTYLEKLLQINY